MNSDKKINPGDILKATNNKAYQVIVIAYNQDNNQEKMLVYQELFDDFRIYVKNYEKFINEFFLEKTENKTQETVNDTGVNPILLEFFDRETCNDKIEYIREIRDKIDERLIDNMAVAMDFTIEDSELDDKINSLLNCLKIKAKFECSRFR